MFISVDVLRSILDNVPGDFGVEYKYGDFTYPISDVVEIDVSGKMVILKLK